MENEEVNCPIEGCSNKLNVKVENIYGKEIRSTNECPMHEISVFSLVYCDCQSILRLCFDEWLCFWCDNERMRNNYPEIYEDEKNSMGVIYYGR